MIIVVQLALRWKLEIMHSNLVSNLIRTFSCLQRQFRRKLSQQYLVGFYNFDDFSLHCWCDFVVFSNFRGKLGNFFLCKFLQCFEVFLAKLNTLKQLFVALNTFLQGSSSVAERLFGGCDAFLEVACLQVDQL